MESSYLTLSVVFENATVESPCRGLQKHTQQVAMPERDMKLTLRETMWSGNGVAFRTGAVIMYEVDGVPPGEKALIRKNPYKDSWQTLREKKGVPGEWTGDYATADDALAVLQKALGGQSP
jgi:hypothetical protein